MPDTGDIVDQQTDLLLDEILETYGYDFRNYARASLRRRVTRFLEFEKWTSFQAMRRRIVSDEAYFVRFMEEITINVTEMFRDAGFYQVLRKEVFPSLATYPFIRIWVAGCSTGEEAFSAAIILKELNILQKSLIYATDINASIIENAGRAIYSFSKIKKYAENYYAAGGSAQFSDYYTANYSYAALSDEIKERVIFSTHNLVSDYSFNEFHLILCRNVLIYFDKHLQARVFDLFDKSIKTLGFIGLGSKETLTFSSVANKYKRISKDKIWRKVLP